MSSIATFSLEHYEHLATLGAFDGKFRRRVELVRGEILDMSPIGFEHAKYVSLLSEWSFEVTPREQVIVSTQNPIRLPSLECEPEPDVAWIKRQDYFQHPEPASILLIIEVAESSLDYDRGEKATFYAEAGISEYWIVNLIEQQIEVYRSPSGGVYQEKSIHRGDDAVHPLALPGASLVPTRIFT